MRRIQVTLAFAGLLLFSLAWSVAAPQQSKSSNKKSAVAAYGNADAITEDELKVYDYFLASDQMEGRNLPSRGYDAAALYIASHLKEWGLKPGGSTEGTDGPLQSYLMPIELVSNQLDAAGMKLSLTIPPPAARGGRGGAGGGGFGGRGGGAAGANAGPRSFDYATQWTIGGGFGGGGRGGGAAAPAAIAEAQLVFVGNGYVINKSNTNPYEGIDVRGKIMVVAGMPSELAAAAAARGAGAGAGGGGRGRGAGPNPLGVENTDFVTPQGYAAKNGALGIIMVPSFQQLSTMANPNAGSGGRGPGLNGPSYQVVKFQAARPASVPTITAGLELTNALFQNEKLSAVQVFEGATANAKLESFEFNAGKKLSLTIAATSDRNHAENVIAMVEGGDPVLKNEFVVFSAHLDHVGLSNPDASGDGIANGADDDASGCASLMAMARTYQEGAAKGMRPKRTMIFLWVAGEEKGLWGSQYFNQFPPVDISKVVLDLNSPDDKPGNDWLRTAALLLPKQRVVLDESNAVLYSQRDVIGYASWGSNDGNRKRRRLGFAWLPGAIATEYVSTDGRTFARPPDSWAFGIWKDKATYFAGSPQSLSADYIEEGATGVSGHVYEPYLHFTPRPDYLLPAYLNGRNLAESYYLSIPALSWQNIVIGDPLCRLRP